MQKRIFPIGIMLLCIVFVLGTLVGWVNKPVLVKVADVQRSVTKSLLILQKSGYTFINKNTFKCASCHHNTLTSMAAGIARQKGVAVIDSFTVHRVKTMENTIKQFCNPSYINQFIPANFIAPYVLLGLSAEKYPADIYTDIAVDYLISQARSDGGFLTESGRVPLETGEIHLTAMAIRAIQLYAPAVKKNRIAQLVANTKQWIEKAQPDQNQEIVFQLLGMQWCGSDKDLKMKVAAKLKSMQNADGGWSQLTTMKSDAYATGQTLYALYESGMAKPEDEAYQKGMNYLLKTQEQEGAWIVATRAYPIQPFFNSDFPPYDENQFISATATNWATMALLNALPDVK